MLLRSPSRNQEPVGDEPFQTWDIADGTSWAVFFRIAAGVLVRFPNLADFEMSADGREIACIPAPEVCNATIEHLYLNQVLPLALSSCGKPVFHASAVEVAAGAIAFIGQSGRGKSTLAAAFAIDGHPFLSDDGLVLEQIDGVYAVQPSHPSLRLWEDSERRLLGEKAEAAPALDYTSKARLLAGRRLIHCNEPRPLLIAYFLGDGSVADIALRRLTEAEAMVELTKHSFLLDVEDKALIGAHFDRTTALANSVPCFALDYPRRYNELTAVVEALRMQVGQLRVTS